MALTPTLIAATPYLLRYNITSTTAAGPDTGVLSNTFMTGDCVVGPLLDAIKFAAPSSFTSGRQWWGANIQIRLTLVQEQTGSAAATEAIFGLSPQLDGSNFPQLQVNSLNETGAILNAVLTIEFRHSIEQ